MNDRINILAEQAGFYVSESRLEILAPDSTTDNITEALREFAELIVAECLEACSRANEIRHLVPPTQEQVALSCMREIETTFRS